ncbi:MAG TPA: L-2-hydroxyglutarate oxidase [Acidimicrobiales bacterium]|nr:L-2-hydroxyglutarate oxidase [Acidimicrobiales bacterium]
MLDVAVVGGGIVGLATARALAGAGLDVAVLEKEDRVAAHQSGNNSNVLHSGVYYPPGSMKAATVRAGREQLQRFCAEHGVFLDVCGKVIVATDQDELARLDALAARADANGVAVERLGPEGLHDVEPHAAGVAALHVPSAAIVDFTAVCQTLARLVGDVRLSTRVTAVHEQRDRVTVETTSGDVTARRIVNCAGLWSDRVASLHARPDVRIIPFRGEYHALADEKTHLVRALIYPVPDPAFPFLGVHLTRGVDGGIHCGPNAVFPLTQLPRVVGYRGFRALARQHWRMGASELARSLSKKRFAASLQRLVPEVDAGDLRPATPGVRAQAVAPDGSLVDDFVIRHTDRVVDVLNAPSPAATAALEIGRLISEEVIRHAAG